MYLHVFTCILHVFMYMYFTCIYMYLHAFTIENCDVPNSKLLVY